MILKIGNTKLEHYNGVRFTSHYDGAASSFLFAFNYEPDNEVHQRLFKPGNEQQVTIEHNGELLLTGSLLYPKFVDGPVFTDSGAAALPDISGYALPGVLGDCPIPTELWPLQTDGLSLKAIAQKFCDRFKLKLVVDSIVSSEANKKITKTAGSDNQSCLAYLTELANQKHIIVSHTAKGELLLTRANTTGTPIYHFEGGKIDSGIGYQLEVNEQGMHSEITVVKQATKSGKGNAGKASIKNPYVSKYRPAVARMTSGENVDPKTAVRNLLSYELKEIKLTINLPSWELGGVFVRPNNLITITNPNLRLNQKTTFFIETVEYIGDNKAETATLHCYLPEVYNTATPKNIFS